MITIVLPVSRDNFLERAVTSLELLECYQDEVNILSIVDGSDELFIRTRNLIALTKFKERLTVKSNNLGDVKQFDIPERRRRISSNHNQAKDLITHNDGYIFCVEDDTLFAPNTLEKLLSVATAKRSTASVEGVEIGRWGVPYVGGWLCDDIYNPTKLTSIQNVTPIPAESKVTNIDAGGLYCTLVKTELYKQHHFHCDNGLGPDVNFGLENRQLGYDNFIDWSVPCSHLYIDMGTEKVITPLAKTQVVTLNKLNEEKWRASY